MNHFLYTQSDSLRNKRRGWAEENLLPGITTRSNFTWHWRLPSNIKKLRLPISIELNGGPKDGQTLDRARGVTIECLNQLAPATLGRYYIDPEAPYMAYWKPNTSGRQ